MDLITASSEARNWITIAQHNTTTPRWEKAMTHLRGSIWEKHGDSELYDDGDVRFILKISLSEPQKFYDILAGLAEKKTTNNRNIVIGGAWMEPGEEGYYGIRVSRAVAYYLQREAGIQLDTPSLLSR